MHPEFPFCFKCQSFTFLSVILYILPAVGIRESSRVGKLHPGSEEQGDGETGGCQTWRQICPSFCCCPGKRVCKSVIRNGERAKGVGGSSKAAIWVPKYLAPVSQRAACKCFRGRAGCGLWFRELTQIVFGPFFTGLQSSVLSGEPEPVLLRVILSCSAGSRLCSEQAVMAGCQKSRLLA